MEGLRRGWPACARLEHLRAGGECAKADTVLIQWSGRNAAVVTGLVMLSYQSNNVHCKSRDNPRDHMRECQCRSAPSIVNKAMTDTSAGGHRPKLVDIAQLTKRERVARAAAAAAEDAAARTIVLSEAPTFLLRVMVRDHREQLAGLLDEAHSGRVDLCANACELLEVASSLADIENELISRRPGASV